VTDEARPRRRTRPLSDDERKLWSTVARSVRPLRPNWPEEAPPPEEPVKAPAKAKPPAGRRAALAPSLPAPKPPPGPPPLAPLGRRLRQRIGRGAEPIDRRLDLHGLTQHEAHHALARFLWAAQADGAKMVLVITGKGARPDRDLFAERGVLRRLVPQWLRQSEFRELVVGFESARAGHGGEGALYVRLRRRRT
jgi:DNA-nicking Smr family endonuclease